MANPAGAPSEESFSLPGGRRAAPRRSASARDLLRIGVHVKAVRVLIDTDDGRRHRVPVGVITRGNLEVEF
mgnify:CR=1 FL=1